MKRIILLLALPLFIFAQQEDSSSVQALQDGEVLTADYISGNAQYNLNDILGLQQGVSLIDGQIHIRGARSALTNYFIDGVFSNDIMRGGNGVYLIPSALERIRLFIDHTPSGLAVSGGSAIMARIKKGGERFEAHFNLQGDGFAPHGQSFFNTYSYGQRIITASIGGPLANGAIHYFLAAENNFKADAMQRYNSGFRFDNVPVQNSTSTVSLNFPQGYTPHSQSNLYALNGALDFSFSGNALRISGSASWERRQNDSRPWLHVLNDRIPLLDTKSTLLSAQFSRRIGKDTFLKVQAGYYKRFSETSDSYLGNDWMSWYDSSKVAEHGATFRDAWRPPYYLSIYNINFSTKGIPQRRYSKNSQGSLFGSLDFEQKLGQRHLLNSGLSARSYTIRYYNIYPSVMLYAADPEYGKKLGGTTYGRYQDVPLDLWILASGLDAYGYDAYGRKINKQKTYNAGDYIFAPMQPLLGSAFIEDLYHYQNTTVRAGLRMDYFDFGNNILKNPKIIISYDDYSISSDNWTKSEAVVHFNPYFSLTGTLNSKLSFFSEYVQGSQSDKMTNYYNGTYHRYSRSTPLSAEQIQPVRTQKINAGINYMPKPRIIFTGRLFYHNYTNLTGLYLQYQTYGSSYLRYNSADNAQIFGLDLNLSFRPITNFWGQFHYSFQKGKGVSSASSIQDAFSGSTALPGSIPLDNIFTHSGTLEMNYAFHARSDLLKNSHVNLLFNFNSGHPFTRQTSPSWDRTETYAAGVHYMTLLGFAHNMEPVNTSKTPWIFNTDLMLDKSFEVSEKLGLTFFIRVTNLFNRKNVLNVFATSGNAVDDGILSDPEKAGKIIEQYGSGAIAFYKDVVLKDGNAYRSVLGKELFGRPRQIFAGIKLAY